MTIPAAQDGAKPRSLEAQLRAWIAADAWRMACLKAVAELGVADAWIGAGFVRALVWDRLHGLHAATPLADVDVAFHDPGMGTADEARLEARLGARMPGVPWSARNQARMHRRNGDRPYRDTADALAHWLETPTAVAARLDAGGRPELLAPFGLDDLFAMTVRPTPHARARRPARGLPAAHAREGLGSHLAGRAGGGALTPSPSAPRRSPSPPCRRSSSRPPRSRGR